MSELEEEIRRRILAERAVEQTQTPPAASPSVPSASGDDAPSRPYYAPPAPPTNPSFLQHKQQQGGIVGAIATALLLLAKIGAPLFAILAKLKFLLVGLKLLTFGKVLLTFSTMLLSMWAYAHFFGWPFGVGMVLLIFIHECGHALAARLRGIPSTLMVFVPFMGAAVFTKRYGKNIVEDAFIGIMGPMVGTLGALACVAGYGITGSPFWLALAEWGFLVNLFNLTPTVPLDGGWIAPVFSPKLLAFGVILLVFVGWRNPFILVLAALSVPRIIGGWRADPKTQPYYQATASDRWRYGGAYFGLAAFLGVGYMLLRHFLLVHHPVLA